MLGQCNHDQCGFRVNFEVKQITCLAATTSFKFIKLLAEFAVDRIFTVPRKSMSCQLTTQDLCKPSDCL